MTENNRQQSLEQLVQSIMENEPSLKEALEVFSLSQQEYIMALSSMSDKTVVVSNSTNPEN